MQLTFFNWFLAFLPVVSVLVFMMLLKWGGSKAGAAAWFITLAVAVLRYGAGAELTAFSQVKAILLSLDVLYIIWAALLFFHTANEAGAVKAIGDALVSLTDDRTLQGLLVSWVFVSFLQGVGGFGVPVAVTAPLMVGMGFSPVQAVIMTSIGHGWAVNFGSMGTAYQSLLAVTNLPGEYLAHETGLLLGSTAIVCGMIVAVLAGGFKGMLRNLPVIIILSIVMGGAQYWVANNRMWTLGATTAGLAGLVFGVGLLKLPFFKRKPQVDAPAAVPSLAPTGKPIKLWVAFAPYVILVILAFATNLITPLVNFLDGVQVSLKFPELTTAYGWTTPAGTGRNISIFGHPGFTLLVSAIIAYFIFKGSGYYKAGIKRTLGKKVLNSAVKSSLGIVAMVGMAILMSHSGMTNTLAQGLSAGFGKVWYPLVAPVIGALGAFITGSNNNSNVLFAVLQQNTAELLKLSVPLILAAQTAGGAVGSILSPAKVIVGCSTVGMTNREGEVLGKLLAYGSIPVIFIALFTMLLSLFTG